MHARPASQIVQMTENAVSEVWLNVDSQRIDASSIIDILAMCAVKGTQVKVEIVSEKDINILDQIVEFFETGFGET
jgi:phosphocarrier protein